MQILIFLFCYNTHFFPDAQSGVLRVWNVSRTTPVENIRLKKTGFHTICLVPRTKSSEKSESNSWNSHVSSTSMAHDPPSTPNSESFVLPPADLLCTFIDGGVGLYNLDKRKWSFLQPMVRTPVNLGVASIEVQGKIIEMTYCWSSNALTVFVW
jgi:hypothetical protein